MNEKIDPIWEVLLYIDNYEPTLNGVLQRAREAAAGHELKLTMSEEREIRFYVRYVAAQQMKKSRNQQDRENAAIIWKNVRIFSESDWIKIEQHYMAKRRE